MRYTWEPDGDAIDQLHDLPDEAVLALVAFMDDVVEDPWNFERQPDEVRVGAQDQRMLQFGARGVVTFWIYEPHAWMNEDGKVLVTRIAWTD